MLRINFIDKGTALMSCSCFSRKLVYPSLQPYELVSRTSGANSGWPTLPTAVAWST